MIATLIQNYETLTVVGVFSITMAWYLWHHARTQADREAKREVRDTKREDKVLNMMDTSLKNIEIATVKNKSLNREIAVIQERTLKTMDAHKTESEAHSRELTAIIRNTLDMSNGSNPIIKKILERLSKVEKKS